MEPVVNGRSRAEYVSTLISSEYKVEEVEVYVIFPGPDDSQYEGWEWKIKIVVPKEYPSELPSIFFINKIYHPNVDELSGLVSIDALKEGYLPQFDLVFVLKNFLKHLLLYPHDETHLVVNVEADTMTRDDPAAYRARVAEYCALYANRVPRKPRPAAGPVDPRPSPSVTDEVGENDTSENPAAGPVDPRPSPSVTDEVGENDTSENPAAGPVDPRPSLSVTDEVGENDTSENPSAGPVDPRPSPSVTDEVGENDTSENPAAGPGDPQPSPSVTQLATVTEGVHDSNMRAMLGRLLQRVFQRVFGSESSKPEMLPL